MRKGKNADKNHKRANFKKIFPFCVGIIVLIVSIMLIILLNAKVPQLPRPHPTHCLEFSSPYATSDGNSGWWVSINITISRNCFFELQNQSCLNCTLTFVFTFDNGTKSPNIYYSLEFKEPPSIGFVDVVVFRTHWSYAVPSNFYILIRQCNF